jgi:hypothetical protein
VHVSSETSIPLFSLDTSGSKRDPTWLATASYPHCAP